MREDCFRKHDNSQSSRKSALDAFDKARQQMMAKPFQKQFDAYRERARALVPYLDLEELSQEAQLADERWQRLRLVRDDLAAAERNVRDVFDGAFTRARSPFIPQSRDVKRARNREVPCSSPVVKTHRSAWRMYPTQQVIFTRGRALQ